MISLIKTALIIFTVVVLLLLGVVFLLSKYARTLEEKTGLGSMNNEQAIREQLSNLPPSRHETAIEVYTPLNFHVYKDKVIPLSGKVQTKNLFISLNGTKNRVVPADQEGKYKLSLTLEEGANVLYFLNIAQDGSISEKRMVVGYYPNKTSDKEYISYSGQVMGLDQKNSTFNLSVGTELFKIKVSPDRLNKMEITETVGVIAEKNKDTLTAIKVDSGNFPFYFYGTVQEKSKNKLIVERERKDGPKVTINLDSKTGVFNWPIASNNLIKEDKTKKGSLIITAGSVRPKEDRANYFAQSVVELIK